MAFFTCNLCAKEFLLPVCPEHTYNQATPTGFQFGGAEKPGGGAEKVEGVVKGKAKG